MKTWMSPRHHAEIDDELIGHMRKLSSEQLKAALEELRKSKKFVRGTKGNQLAVPTIIQTEDIVMNPVFSSLVFPILCSLFPTVASHMFSFTITNPVLLSLILCSALIHFLLSFVSPFD